MKCRHVIYSDLTKCEFCDQKWDTNDVSPPDCPFSIDKRDYELWKGETKDTAGAVLTWERIQEVWKKYFDK